MLRDALALLHSDGAGVVRMQLGGTTRATLYSSRATGRARRAAVYGIEEHRAIDELFGTATVELEAPERDVGDLEIDIATWLDQMATSSRLTTRASS